MIQNNKWNNKNKDWSIGAIVNIGFIKGLEIIKCTAVKDGMPDIYTLKRGSVMYEFVPHNGLSRIN